MSSTKLFTKSRFKTSLSCPTKLYYQANENDYANSKLDDPFLKALAKGGFQVGALAQCYYPNGIEVKHKDYEKSLAETNELLKQKNVIIFEAAIKFNNLFVRVDIFEKIGNVINLIEVKSKSADPSTFEDQVWNKPERKKNAYKLHGDWQEYIYDVAFQAYVIKKAFPDCQVNSYLMCADKTKLANVDGLNQRFLLKEAGRNTEVVLIGDVSKSALGTEILCRLDVNEAVSIIHQDLEIGERFEGRGFEKGIEYLAEMFQKNERVLPVVGSKCKACEFRTESDGKKSGFNECWNLCHGLDAEDLAKPFVFDVWFGAGKALENGKILMEDLDEADFSASLVAEGLSKGQRQWLQVDKTINNDKSSYIDVAGLGNEFTKFTYPLHMIDFETSMAPIPFNKGRHPYEQIAFQFSHHVIFENGTVEHSDEFISSTPGEFPNFNFVRALKKALSRDNGTIFRYSGHENSVLCQIKTQLEVSTESDKDELISFIQSITSKKDSKTKKFLWEGSRNMVDLLALVKSYYYNPAMKGSNSIKYVLPAILNESEFLQKKYSNIYNSQNFTNHIWIKKNEDGSLQDPYKTLGPVLEKYDFETLENSMADQESEINNGGAALTAYAMMQFTQMSDSERNLTREALLRYCELDTLAMVMIYEFWQDVITKKSKKKNVKAS